MKRFTFLASLLAWALIPATQTGCAAPLGHVYTPPTDASFAALRIGVDTQATVRQALGAPLATTYLSLRDMHAWSYKFRQAGVWPSLMHVLFDRSGVLRDMMAGPDPDFEEKRGLF